MIDDKFVHAIAGLRLAATKVDPIVIEPAGLLDGEVAGRLFRIAVPDGIRDVDVTDALLKTLPTPQYRSGNTEIASLESFIDYANRMKESSTVLFANPTKSTIEAVFDYHDEVNPGWNVVDGGDPDSDTADTKHMLPTPLPRWGRFRAKYPFPLHRSWKVWSGKDKTPMSQADLANFIEDNIIDVHDTQDGTTIMSGNTKTLIKELGLKLAGRSKLLTAARGLSLQITEKVGQVVNTQTGETTIHYDQTHSDGSPPAPGSVPKLDVPSAFIILLPVFNGADAFELLVRLRYRKDGASLKWWYDIYNLDRAMELAFEDACGKITTGTGLPLFYVNA